MTVIERIKALAYEKGISMSFLCKKMNVARVYFNDIQKNGRTIPDDKLAIIAGTLGTSVEYLLGKTEQKEKPTVNDGERDALERDIMELLDSLSPDKREQAIDYLKYLSNSK